MTAFLLAILVFISSEYSLPKEIQLKDFHWLQGTWKRTDIKSGSPVFEVWSLEQDQMVGFGYKLEQGDSIITERLKIFEKDGSYYYSADVRPNPKPIDFKIIQVTTFGFISENPGHDFPKKIEYITLEDLLKVIISDETKELSFSFRKTNN